MGNTQTNYLLYQTSLHAKKMEHELKILIPEKAKLGGDDNYLKISTYNPRECQFYVIDVFEKE